MKIRNVLKVIGLGASLATVTTACGTKDGAVSTVAEMPETVVSTENETVAETETETQEIADELTLEEVRAELEGYKDRIKEAGYDYKSVGFETKYFDLRKGGAEPEQALTMTIEYFDAENASMGELETATETQTGEVYVSGTPVGEEVGTGSNATSGELSEEQIAEEKAAEEAAKKAEAEAKRQAEAQAQTPAQVPQEQTVVQEQVIDAKDASQWNEYDRRAMENMDKSNPNYGKTGADFEGGVVDPSLCF